MTREDIHAARLTLRPMSEAQARSILSGESIGVPIAKGWPHDDTPDAILGGLSINDPDALPWLIVLQPDANDDDIFFERDADGRDAGEVIGDLGWKGTPGPDGDVEIGYGLSAEYRGQGYGGEAVGAFVGWLESRDDVRRVLAEIKFDNLASRRLVERLGFEYDHLASEYVWYAYEIERAKPEFDDDDDDDY